jgi:hypothetical protein
MQNRYFILPSIAVAFISSVYAQGNVSSNTRWPDGRTLTHPDHFVTTGLVKVARNDTLKLRAGPGTGFTTVAEIPANATEISAFDQDQVWDGDTWWCPVEWEGYRGYVGRSHLPGAPSKNSQWPDGRTLAHPDQSVITRVVKVAANDTLTLRAGPGTAYNAVAKIPPDANDLQAFDHDQIWDGDTWWYPVQWEGYRGYVGRSHLPNQPNTETAHLPQRDAQKTPQVVREDASTTPRPQQQTVTEEQVQQALLSIGD